MGYPGDTTLSREIQLRILSTFKQTLRHADSSRWDEAHLGCDFMLRLDPAFEPARALKRRMTDDTVVELEDLREIADQAKLEPGASAVPEAPGLLLVDDGETDSDLAIEPDLLKLDLEEEAAPAESAQEAAPAEGVEEEASAKGVEGEAPADGLADEFELELDQALSDLEIEGDAAEGEIELLIEEPASATGEQASRLDKESKQRIAELLSEGQGAYDRKEFQQAIDAWSRIFLIDIDHVEASRLIDEARLLKAEAERELDEILHEGIAHLEVGEYAMARDAFNRVLALQPNHLVAKEYLGQLETEPLGLDDEIAAESVAAEPARAPRKERVEAAPAEEEATEPERPEPEELDDLELEATELPKKPPSKAPRRSFLYIGSAVLVLALAAAWYLFSHWDQIFPNSTQEAAVAAGARRADPIERARELHEAGKTTMAISQLERLAPEDPKYAEGQALLAQFQAPEGDDEADDESLESNLMVATLENQFHEAYDDKRFLKSSMILDRIAEIQPLSEDQMALRADLDARLEPIESQIAMIRQGEWEYALPQLWRMLDERPNDRDVMRLLIDGYFNLGVRDLQRGHPTEAAEKFREALALSPDDAEIQRLDAFAKAYEAKPQDLRYRIFIKYVPFR